MVHALILIDHILYPFASAAAAIRIRRWLRRKALMDPVPSLRNNSQGGQLQPP